MRNSTILAVTLSVALSTPIVGLAEEGPASQKSLSEELVDAFNAVYGAHPGIRANHEKKLLFVPGASVPGIEPADPMIAARSAAYIVSLSRRAQAK